MGHSKTNISAKKKIGFITGVNQKKYFTKEKIENNLYYRW